MTRRSLIWLAIGALLAAAGMAASSASSASSAGRAAARAGAVNAAAGGIHRIKHVVVIMQENRSFDQYFGTFPGADGIPGLAGHPGWVPCLPNAISRRCAMPFHDRQDANFGGPHGAGDAFADMNCRNRSLHLKCRMNAFVKQAEHGKFCGTLSPNCSPCTKKESTCVDVMGYHTAAEIPNYWKYASAFVLQDHLFEPNQSWSLPQHLFMVSEWSASCRNGRNPFTCKNALERPGHPHTDHYAWTDITYLLHKYGVSWGYYVDTGIEPDCVNGSVMTCAAARQSARTPSLWNPLPSFTDVATDGQLGNIQPVSSFIAAAKAGKLPAVSWVTPSRGVSEHPPQLVSAGQEYVTGLLNALMQSPDWKSTAIFLTWDDWGGFYDQVVPPVVDRNGFGLRVPGMLISPYAKRGYVDHQTLSHDAYNKFIENDFLGGQSLDPSTDGRPDPRPDVRETSPLLGSLVKEFNFRQRPRPPVILPVCPRTDLVPKPHC